MKQVALIALLCSGQTSKLPTVDEVKKLQGQYQAERTTLVTKGADKRFLPELLIKADEIARRAEKALQAGRLLQASEGFRQARWQLPYQSPQVPAEHVAKVLGNLRMRHAGEINALAFSPDGERLATGSRDRTVKIWDLGNGHELFTFLGHKSHVRTLDFSPDGKMVASAGSEADIKVWDAATGKDIVTLPGQGIYVTSLAFTRDGKHLFAGQAAKQGANSMLCLYEIPSGKLLAKVDDFRLLVTHLAQSPDGNLLAVASGDGEVRLWEQRRLIENPKQPAYWTKQDPTGAAYHVAISPDGKSLARCGGDGLKIYNLPMPNTPFQASDARFALVPPKESRFVCATFSRDGKTLFAGSSDGAIRLYDMETQQPAGVFKGHNGEIRDLTFNPAATRLASASADFTVRFWDFDIVLQARDFVGHQAPVWKASFSPDGSRIVSASADRSVKVWDVASGEAALTLSGHSAPVTIALFSPDGKVIASAGGDKVIRLWNAVDGKPLHVLEGHQGTITSLDMHGDKLVSGSVDKTVRLWDLKTGKELESRPPQAVQAVVASVAFSPDGGQVAVGCIDQTVRLLDIGNGKSAAWVAHAGGVTGVAYSPDGKYLATCGVDQLVRLWSLSTWPMPMPAQPTMTLSGHTGPLSAVAFRKDSQHLVSCGSDLLVKLWKIDNGAAKEAQSFRGHRDWITSVAFSRDGHYFVSAGVDRTIKVWEITSREIPLLAEHTGMVIALALSPDGKLIASGGSDQIVKIWDRQTGVELASFDAHAGIISALHFTPDSKTLISAGFDRNLKLWDVDAAKPKPLVPGQQQSWTGFLSAIPLMCMSKDAKKLVVWEPANERYTKFNVFDFETGKETIPSFNDNRSVVAVSIASNGKVIATAGKNGSVRLFDLDKNGQMFPGGDWVLFDFKVSPGDLALSRDASFLIVGSDIGELKFCSVAERKVLHTVKGHDGFVAACQVSPDGKRAATLGKDNVIKLWDTATAKELRRWDLGGALPDGSSLVMNLAFTPDSRQIVTANANTTLFVLDAE